MPPSAHKKDPPPHRHPPTQLGHSRAVAQPRCRLVGDVHGVSVDRRHADRCEVVREVSSRVELAVLGAVAAAFLVRGAPGEVAEEAGPAGGYAPEALY